MDVVLKFHISTQTPPKVGPKNNPKWYEDAHIPMGQINA